jgi:hypothetical protein
VAINVFGDVAFHGKSGSRNAVFTDAGLFAKAGDGQLDSIINAGKVAINTMNQVAFHGKNGGTSEVYISDGQTIVVAAHDLDLLDDGTSLESIYPAGGVAMDLFGTVAFHGTTPILNNFSIPGVFTQLGLVAKEGDTLTDGTILGSIDLKGGVAINIIGDVAFIGRVLDPQTNIDTVRAVFTQDGPVVKEGDTLDDGTTLDEISDGVVALNDLGEVAFHGRTGGIPGVFTQHGLVAKQGDNLDDNTTLTEILVSGGVALNAPGEVAFHGKTRAVGSPSGGPKVVSPNVVVVGLAPPPPNPQ